MNPAATSDSAGFTLLFHIPNQWLIFDLRKVAGHFQSRSGVPDRKISEDIRRIRVDSNYARKDLPGRPYGVLD